MIIELSELEGILSGGKETMGNLVNQMVVNLDLRKSFLDWSQVDVQGCAFLGCTFKLGEKSYLEKRGAMIYPHFPEEPYRTVRSGLYTWQELMEGFDGSLEPTVDFKIYDKFVKNKYQPNVNEALRQRLHDYSIDRALFEFIGQRADGSTKKKCVGIMGGHGVLRGTTFYVKAAFVAKGLAENGFLVISGGGPGIMEAANMGAYFAGRSNQDLLDAISYLEKAPHFDDANYVELAMDVVKKYPDGTENLAIPTWFYGHEPSNLFASHVAKYFSNSIREGNLLAISIYGVVYAPGSAGTTQEIFTDAAQNHYASFNFHSPMVFLGSERYMAQTNIFGLVQQLSYGKKYHELLKLTDDPEEVVQFIVKHPPLKA